MSKIMHACIMYIMQNYILIVLKLPFKKSKVVKDPRKNSRSPYWWPKIRKNDPNLYLFRDELIELGTFIIKLLLVA